jgi:hypothetical protein
MGGKQSKPSLAELLRQRQQNQRIVLPPSIPAPIPCDVKKVELNTLKRDATAKQTEVDTCDPATKKARVLAQKTAELNGYISTKTDEFFKESAILSKTIALADSLSESAKPIQEYSAEVRKKRDALVKENEELEYTIRSNRRRFMDGDPQNEFSTVLGLKTTDDKIMFFFWGAYLLAAVTVAIVLVSAYGPGMSRVDKITAVVATAAICYGIAYYAIYKFA